MKIRNLCLLQVAILIFFCCTVYANPNAGFFLPDSVQEMKLKFRTIKNLIILPVVINDSIKVNLILDTGCRNLVLFGKRFQKLLKINPGKEVIFSGLGSGNAVSGKLSLGNKVGLETIQGTGLPIVIVNDKNVFGTYNDIHGIIGYDIFLKFEIEINPRVQVITFRPALRATPRHDYAQIPLQIVDSRPLMQSSVAFSSGQNTSCDLMIDTGSSLGLLLKTTDTESFDHDSKEVLVGRGLNGPLYAYQTIVEKLSLPGFSFDDIETDIVKSEWHNYASIGMEILKDYILVLNYCKAYACLKKIV